MAGVASVAVAALGLVGAVPQPASAAASAPTAAKAAPAVTPSQAAAQVAAKLPSSAKTAYAAAAAGQQALAKARQTGKMIPVTADQNPFSQTVANPDGSFTTSTSAQPRWVQSGSAWVSADATLARQSDGSYAPKAALGTLSLSGGGSDVLATTTTGGHSLAVTWPSVLPAPAVSGTQATYANVFPGVNLVVTANVSGGFSQTLVILNKAAAADPQLANLSLGLSASAGLTAHPGSDGSLTEEDSAGKAVFYSPAPAAWDSGATGASISGPGSGGHAVTAPASYSGNSVKLGVPASLLAGPASSFPVYVDPSYNDAAFWAWYGQIQSGNPGAAELNNTPDYYVSVGYDSSGSIDRGNYTFGLPDSAVSAPVTVSAATMTTTAVSTYTNSSQSHTVNAYDTSEYDGSSTWNNPPAVQAGPVAATFTTTSTYPDQNVSWNVASWVQSAFSNDDWYLSAELRNSDEAHTAPFVEFGSNPTLTYTYTQAAPAVPAGTGPVPGATFLHFPVSDKAALAVNVGSGNALVTTSDLSMPGMMLGADYNSLLTGTALSGAEGNTWRQRQGADTRLYPGAGTTGSITYLGADGLSGVFTTSNGSSYTSPADVHATLVTGSAVTSACSGSSYQLNWHSSGQIQCFNGAGLLTSQADRNGNTTAFTYTYGLESSVTYTPKGASSPSETVTGADVDYPWTLQLTQSGGAAGTKTVSYNVNEDTGDLSSIQQADSTTLTFGYDGSDNLNSIKNGAGVTTTLVYDSSHRVTSVSQTYGTASATATTRFSYVSSTETQVAAPNTSQGQPVGSVPNTTYTVNSAGLVTATKDAAGDTVNTAYDSSTNNVTQSTNALNGATTNTWGSNNGESETKSVSPTGAYTSAAYNNTGTGTDPEAQYLPSSSNDTQNHQTLYTYDGAGNLSQSSDALPAVAKVTPNSDGTPATSTDPDGGATSYSYNSLHQLTKVTPPTSGSLTPVSLTYDGFGRVATVTDGNGNTLTYTYDLADRITKQAYTGGAKTLTVSYAYDGAGNLKTQTSSAGPTTSYTYDGRNQVLTTSATSGGGTLAYTYDADGNMLTAKDGAGTGTYTYNNLDQLTGLTDPAGAYWQFSYNAAGERSATYYGAPAGQTANYQVKDALGFDTSGRITSIDVTGSNGAATLAYNTYCYSPYVSGQACPTASASTDTELVQWSQNKQTSAISQYTYDNGNRLKTATNLGGSNYSYGYDNDGDITAGASAGSLSYNTANQITTSGYGYDHDGNQTADPKNGTLAGNDASQLISASAASGGGAGSAAETFTYSGAGQNQPLSDGSASGITYGQGDQYGQPRIDSYTTGGATIYIIRDQQGDPLGLISGGKSYIYLTDNSGSVTGLSGSCGCSDASYTYTPYGSLASKSAGSGGSLVTQNLIGYTGSLTDTYTAGSTGYIHDGARWYNPQTGAFAGQDTGSYLNNPANGNRYAYAADNPVNNTDPTGMWSWTDFADSILNNAVKGVIGGCIAGAIAGEGVGCVAGIVPGSIIGGLTGGPPIFTTSSPPTEVTDTFALTTTAQHGWHCL